MDSRQNSEYISVFATYSEYKSKSCLLCIYIKIKFRINPSYTLIHAHFLLSFYWRSNSDPMGLLQVTWGYLDIMYIFKWLLSTFHKKYTSKINWVCLHIISNWLTNKCYETCKTPNGHLKRFVVITFSWLRHKARRKSYEHVRKILLISSFHRFEHMKSEFF